MDYQYFIEQSYLKLTTKEHRKNLAQFFTPAAIANLMAAYILDNPECKRVLDPAAGLSIFARAIDEQLQQINLPELQFHLKLGKLNTLNAQQRHNYSPQEHQLYLPKTHHTIALSSLISLLTFNSEEANYLYKHSQGLLNNTYAIGLSPRLANIEERASKKRTKSRSHALASNTLLNTSFKLSHSYNYSYQANLHKLVQTNKRSYMNLAAKNKFNKIVSYAETVRYPLDELLQSQNSSGSATNTANTALSAGVTTSLLSPSIQASKSLTLEHSPNQLVNKLTSKLQNLEQYELECIYSELQNSAADALENEGYSSDELDFSEPKPNKFEPLHLPHVSQNMQHERHVKMVAYEIDPIIYEFNSFSQQQAPLQYVNYQLKQNDYLKSNFRERYDGIICNPPYLTFKEYAHYSQVIDRIESRLALELPGRINLYALFLLKSLFQLKPKGRCVYLIPYEFLNSSFGIKVKEQFIRQKNLAYVINFDINIPIFDNANTTCGLFLFDNAKRQEHIEFITIHSLDELDALKKRLCPQLTAKLQQANLIYGTLADNARTPATELVDSATYEDKASYAKVSEQSSNKSSETTHFDSLVSNLDAEAIATLESNFQGRFSDVLHAPALLASVLTNQSLPKKASLLPKLTWSGEYQDLLRKLYIATHPSAPKYSPCGRKVAYSSLSAKQKWHIYYQDRTLIDKLKGHKLNSLDKLSTFDHFIKVRRGIATGANEFFLFNKSKMRSLDLKEEFFVPAIPKAHLAKLPIFTKQDYEKLIADDEPVFLLNAPEEVKDKALSKYLEYGRSQNIHHRYLTRHRCPWYSLERHEVAPILMSVFNRGSIHVVRNEAQIYNLTTFHSIFVLDESKLDLIFAYMLTPLAKEIILQNRREYGGGLEKLEPLDINHAACVNFSALSDSAIKEILQHYSEYRSFILESAPKLPSGQVQNQSNELILELSNAFNKAL